jgi:hypothetical protein
LVITAVKICCENSYRIAQTQGAFTVGEVCSPSYNLGIAQGAKRTKNQTVENI